MSILVTCGMCRKRFPIDRTEHVVSTDFKMRLCKDCLATVISIAEGSE